LKRVDDKLDALVAGCANQTDLLNRKFDQVVAGLDNQSDLLSRKFDQVVAGLDNQSDLLSRKFDQVSAGLDNQSDLLNQKFDQMIAGLADQSVLLNRKFDRLIEGVIRDRGFGNGAVQVPDAMQAPPATLREAMERRPLLIAERTYNTAHPGYDARVVRNFPGHLFNHDKSCENPALQVLGRLAQGDEVPDQAWPAVLGETLVEAASVPYAAQVFERRIYVEQYMNELGRKYHAHYVPGWVNLDDALFLYWLVRQVKPRTIVQTGVCNGLSAAFMMLGLVKNGPEGRLHVIDLPPVFDPRDAAWTVEGKVYGFVIPEGKTSGWLVPDAYRDRFEVWNGDAADLLPKMVDKVDSIDFFYHDSDHSYNHMMFEFHQAKRKLNKGGLVVGDDVSWNASLWDFADEFGVPAYNFKGAVGVAFF
jgi:predicted O-methyltransferase YrrM